MTATLLDSTAVPAGVTVRDIVELRHLRATLLAGAGGLERRVSWAHVSDAMRYAEVLTDSSLPPLASEVRGEGTGKEDRAAMAGTGMFGGFCAPGHTMSASLCRCGARSFIVDAVQTAGDRMVCHRRDWPRALDYEQTLHADPAKLTFRSSTTSSAVSRSSARYSNGHLCHDLSGMTAEVLAMLIETHTQLADCLWLQRLGTWPAAQDRPHPLRETVRRRSGRTRQTLVGLLAARRSFLGMR
jgi:hypothetical protein